MKINNIYLSRVLRLGAAGFVIAVMGLGVGCATNMSKVDPEQYKETVRNTIRTKIPEVGTCYEETIEKRPGAEGKLVLVWDIEPDGKVGKIGVKSADPKIVDVNDCVINKIKSLQFPPTPLGQIHEISYPFIFSENGKNFPQGQ